MENVNLVTNQKKSKYFFTPGDSIYGKYLYIFTKNHNHCHVDTVTPTNFRFGGKMERKSVFFTAHIQYCPRISTFYTIPEQSLYEHITHILMFWHNCNSPPTATKSSSPFPLLGHYFSAPNMLALSICPVRSFLLSCISCCCKKK